MIKLHILQWPHATLSKRAHEVSSFDDELKRLVDGMEAAMLASGGIGLSANQVGELRRVLIARMPGELKTHVIINPTYVASAGQQTESEGCLSFPDMYGTVKRYNNILIKYFDLLGNERTMHASGLLSICIQHEIDHLDGIVFTNRMHDKEQAELIELYMSKLANTSAFS